MRNALRSISLIGLALFCCGFLSTNVRLDHWSYEAVDKLIGWGLIDSAMMTTRPVSRLEMARHIAEAEEGWFRHVVAQELEEWPSHHTFENYPDRSAIKRALDAVHRYTEAYLESLAEPDLENVVETPWGAPLPLRWIVWHVLEHEVHHCGELSLILGLLGKEGLDV